MSLPNPCHVPDIEVAGFVPDMWQVLCLEVAGFVREVRLCRVPGHSGLAV